MSPADATTTLTQGGTGDIQLPPPLVAYRVYPDGHEELVRGASFRGVSFHALRDIVALGKDVSVFNTSSNQQLVSVIAPSVLVKELEVKKPNQDFEKPPAFARPIVSAP